MEGTATIEEYERIVFWSISLKIVVDIRVVICFKFAWKIIEVRYDKRDSGCCLGRLVRQ